LEFNNKISVASILLSLFALGDAEHDAQAINRITKLPRSHPSTGEGGPPLVGGDTEGPRDEFVN
jgi:hypothetical protein